MYSLDYLLSRLAEGFHDGLDCYLAIDIEDAVFVSVVCFFDNVDTKIYCCEFTCEYIVVRVFSKVSLLCYFLYVCGCSDFSVYAGAVGVDADCL